MNMEYWVGVVQVVNGVSFFGMLFAYGASALLLAIWFEESNSGKSPIRLLRLSAVAFAVGVVFTLLLIFVPSTEAVKAMYR